MTIFENWQQIVVVVRVVVVESSIVENHAVVRAILGGGPPVATSDAAILFLTLLACTGEWRVCVPYHLTQAFAHVAVAIMILTT